MRIPSEEAQIAVGVVKKHLGESASVWLFGSRADDTKKGGDIDLYVETEAANVALPTARARGDLADMLGRHVDLVVNNHTRDEPIFDVARKYGVRLA